MNKYKYLIKLGEEIISQKFYSHPLIGSVYDPIKEVKNARGLVNILNTPIESIKPKKRVLDFRSKQISKYSVLPHNKVGYRQTVFGTPFGKKLDIEGLKKRSKDEVIEDILARKSHPSVYGLYTNTKGTRLRKVAPPMPLQQKVEGVKTIQKGAKVKALLNKLKKLGVSPERINKLIK